MMSKSDDLYTPEHVDEQVDALLYAREIPIQDQPIAHHLRSILFHLSKQQQRADAQVLQRVLQKFLNDPSFTQGQDGNRFPFTGHIVPIRKHERPVMKTKAPRNHSFGRLLTTLAAVLVVAVLVGSMLLITNLARQGHTASPGPTWQGTNPPQGVYVSSEQGLFRLDPQAQQRVWQQSLKNEGIAQILPTGNVVYVSQHSKQQPVVALDAKSGKILWTPALELPSAGDVGGLVFSNGRLYVQTAELTYVFDAFTRKQLAVYPGGDDLAVGDGVLAISRNGGLQVYSLTSNVGWSKPIDTHAVAFSLSIVNHLLYAIVASSNNDLAGQGQRYIIAYKVSTGEQVWKSPIFHVDSGLGFTVEQNIVYFGTLVTDVQSGSWTGSVYAYDIQKNLQLWSKPVDGGVQSTPVISAGTLYVTADGADNEHHAHVIALAKATGTIKWQQTLTSQLADNFCVSNGVIYIANVSDGLYALNAVNGSKLWEDTQLGSPTAVVPTA